MNPTAMLDELQNTGLVAGDPTPHLTVKGRDWLRALTDVETHEASEMGEEAADLILSTNALIR